jgi:hypothetical protein
MSPYQETMTRAETITAKSDMWARIDAIFRTRPGPPVLHQRAAKDSFVKKHNKRPKSKSKVEAN